MRPALSMSDLTRSFEGRKVVDALDLSVPAGEIHGLIGPDGAGKSTTLRMVCGLVRPDSGRIEITGAEGGPRSRRAREIVGYMPQRFSLYPDLSVAENLRFFADLFGLGRAERSREEERLLAFSRLAPFRERRAGQLSGGMKQKLALSCTLIHRPRILVLDEPTTGVDPVSREEFWGILRGLADDGLALLVSTPYMDEAALCDRVVLMQAGRILAAGSPAELSAGYARSLLELSGSDLNEARKVLTAIEGADIDVQRFGDRLHVSFAAPADGRLLRERLAGLDVSLREIEASIEDVFVERTARGERDAA